MRWLPVWESVMRSSGMYQQQREKHHDALFVKLHVWQPATILRLSPFMYRLPEKVLTVSVWQIKGILLNHFKLVTELGGEVVQVQSSDVLGSIVDTCREKQITTVCMGSPSLSFPKSLFMILKYRKFVRDLAQVNIDLIILA